MIRPILLFSFILLSGCTAEQMAQWQEQQAAAEQAQIAQVESEKKQYCANMGAPEGSPNYYNCRRDIEARLDMAVIQRMEDNRAQQQREQEINDKFYEGLRQSTQKTGTRCESYESNGRVITECN